MRLDRKHSWLHRHSSAELEFCEMNEHVLERGSSHLEICNESFLVQVIHHCEDVAEASLRVRDGLLHLLAFSILMGLAINLVDNLCILLAVKLLVDG